MAQTAEWYFCLPPSAGRFVCMESIGRRERTGAGLAAGAMLLVGGSVAASSLLVDYPILGGQGVRYLLAGALLAGWACLRRHPLPRPRPREWGWLIGLGALGLAGLSVAMIEASRAADPVGLGVIIGAAPLAIVLIGSATARRRPTRRLLAAAVVVTLGAALAQFGVAAGSSPANLLGILLSFCALGGAVATTLCADPVLPRLGPLAVTIYSCTVAGVLALTGAVVLHWTRGDPILRIPSCTELGALGYLAVVVTAIVFVAWYAAMSRLGAERTGIFNGLIPVASLLAVGVVGTGDITPVRIAGAGAVLSGVVLALIPARTTAPTSRTRPRRSTTPAGARDGRRSPARNRTNYGPRGSPRERARRL